MATSETLEFKAELKQLLHLITHSLYSDRDIFLRELISNASDAINKIKFDALQHEELLEGNTDWKITITPDAASNTLSIADNGIGMTRDEVIDCLGTVAKSGTKAFLEALKARQSQDVPGLIGQFGVGFYSAFMVADKVTVLTRPAGAEAQATRWESDGQGEFHVSEAEKPSRGTEIILHLKADAKDFLEPYKLRSLVKKFSDFIEHPVELVTTTEKDGQVETKQEILNSRKAVWLRTPREVTQEEYNEFYKQISHDPDPPARVIHFDVEGDSPFRSLLFIPAKKPFGFDLHETAGLRLYVQRVLIMEHSDQVLPVYLRFVKGVVDSTGLPLNVSREMLQAHPKLEVIRKSVTRNVLSSLAGLLNVDRDQYLTFYQNFGSILKEGLARDWENKEKVADLLLFESANTEPGKLITLAEYVEKMPSDQEKILFLTGETAELLRQSPYLEAHKAKGYDVLLMTDPVDEFAMPYLHEYKGKALLAADREDLQAKSDELPAEVLEPFSGLLSFIKGHLPEVSDVRLSKRLTESAACLVADPGEMSANLERLLRRAGEQVQARKRVLELNPDHPTVKGLRALFTQSADDARIPALARLLYDQAVIAEGSKINDPAGFAKRLNDLMARVLA